MKRILSCALLLLMSACASTTERGNDPTSTEPSITEPINLPPPKDYAALRERTELEIKRAADKGFLWLNTESYLAEADEANKAGDTEKAMELAQKALVEALLAQKQAAESTKVKADFKHGR